MTKEKKELDDKINHLQTYIRDLKIFKFALKENLLYGSYMA